MKTFTFLLAMALPVSSAFAAVPTWFETDSASAIHARIMRDFPHKVTDAPALFPSLTQKQIDSYIKNRYIETLLVDDTMRVHRKAKGNLPLLLDKVNGKWTCRGSAASDARKKYVYDILDQSKGDGSLSNLHKVKVRFTIDVPYNDLFEGDTLSVWMPVPMKSTRQPGVKILSSSRQAVALSTPGRSVHNTLFFTAPVVKGDTAKFEYTAEFIVGAQYFSPEYIMANMKPYDKESDLYKKYTSVESPNIPDMKDLARKIVGKETNPFKCSELVYDHIIRNYPWAGAREYSTIPCLPEYVVAEGHGDCGQVSLLYISLMRSLGIPARWESGWMLHPGEKNLHDWAEVYFEGVGWVPVDVSFGRYTAAERPEAVGFYSHGMDQFRMATNMGVNGNFFPAKRHVRSETVDSQMGEVETTRANLFYPGWDQHLEIISFEPVK